MKPSIFILLFLRVGNFSFAQSPNWQWAEIAVGNGTSYSASITSDGSGNVYVTGYFTGPTIIFGNYILTNAGDSANIFVVKYDSLGNVVWAKSFGGMGTDEGNGITIDGSGNIYLTGYFTSPVIIFGNDTLTNAGAVGHSSFFIVKSDSAGTVVWAKDAGGIFNSVGKCIGADANGNVYAAGYFHGDTIVFGIDTLKNTGANSYNIFVVKYDLTGNVNWAESIWGTSSYTYGQGISLDANGNVYMMGNFTSDTIVFGNDTISTLGGQFIFIVKYDSSGAVHWVRSIAGTYNWLGSGISADVNGNVYIIGSFQNDSIISGSFSIIKYDSSGALIWARSAGGVHAQAGGNNVCNDVNGNVYITGDYIGAVTFGNDTLKEYGLTDIFLVKYDASGTEIWAQGAGGIGLDAGTGISVDSKRDVYITGYFSSDTVVLGSDTSIVASGYEDVFVAKLSNTTTGIERVKNISDGISIYPNPAQNIVTIEWPETNAETNIIIYDLLGREISNLKTDGAMGSIQIDIGDISDGLYVVQIISVNGVAASSKLLKLR